jgi:dUTP pyrophosphatase
MNDAVVDYIDTFDTGVHVAIPEGYVGFIKSKSGLMVNHNITTDGTIDAHYTGSIKVKLFNHGEPYYVHAGDKIAQLVILKCELPELELVDHLEETDRGDGGFGSTGR